MTVLTGGTGNNVLTGVGANNQISGLDGTDTITGAASYDLINGGVGNDTLNGKAGGDVYEWSTGDGNDTITDDGASLVETDTLKLTNVASTGRCSHPKWQSSYHYNWRRVHNNNQSLPERSQRRWH